MRFEPEQLVFSTVSPKILRDCAIRLREYDSYLDGNLFDYSHFCICLGAPEDESLPVFKGLVEMGALVIDKNNPAKFKLGESIGNVALAKISKGLTRTEAKTLLDSVVARAMEMNNNPSVHEYKVTKIAVFGSYLTEKEVLGDIDIAVDIVKVTQPNYKSNNWMDRQRSMSVKAYSFLRLRKPEYISIHKMDELERLNTTSKVVFKA